MLNIENFESRLNDNKAGFVQSSLKMLEELPEVARRLLLLPYQVSPSVVQGAVFDCLLRTMDDFLKSEVSYNSNASQNQLAYSKIFLSNFIRMELRYPERNDDEQQLMSRFAIAFSANSHFEYMNAVNGWSEFRDISNFRLYKDSEISEAQYAKVFSSDFPIDKEQWLNYIKLLVTYSFSDFEAIHSKRGNHYYCRKIADDQYVLIYYADAEIKKYLSKRIYFPEVFNLFLVNSQAINQLFAGKPLMEALPLGVLINPFFNQLIPSPEVFSQLRFYYKIVDDNDHENYHRKFIRTESGYSVKYPLKFEEEIKMHTFVYMDLLRRTINPYLSYLERSIEEICQN